MTCIVQKEEKQWWKKLLRGDAKTPHYVKVDWDKWVDEDDDGSAGGKIDSYLSVLAYKLTSNTDRLRPFCC